MHLEQSTAPTGLSTTLLQDHPIAGIFPLLPETELAALAEDVKARGVEVPIVLYEGKILDGRNRYRAATRVGAHFATNYYTGQNPVEHVLSLNLHRRHLSPSQAAAVAVEALPHFEAEAKKRQGTRTDLVANLPQCSETGTKSRDHAAESVNVSPRLVQDAKAIKAADPVMFEAVRRGEKTVNEAKTELRRTEVKAKLTEVAARAPQDTSGVFDVIVCDPPWPMEKIERDVRPNQTEFDYPTMTEEELRAFGDVRDKAAEGCHLFLWTTHKFLPLALELTKTWGFAYCALFVWHKPGGFQPMGLPQFNCEFAIYARRGAPSFIDTKAFNTCFEAPRGAHSEKPEEFYETLRRVTGGRRLDMFNRRPIEGFIGWGKEAA